MTDGYYKCDRCGEFERGPIRDETLTSPDYADPELRHVEYGHLNKHHDQTGVSWAIDLCVSCRQDLTEFLGLEQDDCGTE